MLTPKEFEIMQPLWAQSPLSCSELLQSSRLQNATEKSVHEIIRIMLRKNMIKIVDTRKGIRKPIRLYAPLVTEIEYMAQQIESIPNYEADTRLPPLFQHLIRSVKKRSTIAILHEIIAEAEKNLE